MSPCPTWEGWFVSACALSQLAFCSLISFRISRMYGGCTEGLSNQREAREGGSYVLLDTGICFCNHGPYSPHAKDAK